MTDRTETASLDLVAYRAALGALRQMVAAHLAEALLQGDDAEHRRTVRLARGLDEAGLNLDTDIEGQVIYQHHGEPEHAWKPPSARKSAELGDPWNDDPPF